MGKDEKKKKKDKKKKKGSDDEGSVDVDSVDLDIMEDDEGTKKKKKKKKKKKDKGESGDEISEESGEKKKKKKKKKRQGDDYTSSSDVSIEEFDVASPSNAASSSKGKVVPELFEAQEARVPSENAKLFGNVTDENLQKSCKKTVQKNSISIPGTRPRDTTMTMFVTSLSIILKPVRSNMSSKAFRGASIR